MRVANTCEMVIDYKMMGFGQIINSNLDYSPSTFFDRRLLSLCLLLIAADANMYSRKMSDVCFQKTVLLTLKIWE